MNREEQICLTWTWFFVILGSTQDTWSHSQRSKNKLLRVLFNKYTCVCLRLIVEHTQTHTHTHTAHDSHRMEICCFQHVGIWCVMMTSFSHIYICLLHFYHTNSRVNKLALTKPTHTEDNAADFYRPSRPSFDRGRLLQHSKWWILICPWASASFFSSPCHMRWWLTLLPSSMWL